jgi:hypothetical protein
MKGNIMKKETYYIAETMPMTSMTYNRHLWEPTKAKSLSGAKRVALERRRAQWGTELHVGLEYNESGYIESKSVRIVENPLHANTNEHWLDLDY